jgi:hypothetical protein
MVRMVDEPILECGARVDDHESMRAVPPEGAGDVPTKLERVLDVTVSVAEPRELADSHTAAAVADSSIRMARRRSPTSSRSWVPVDPSVTMHSVPVPITSRAWFMMAR